MVLYHISLNLDIVDEFIPRIPSNRFRGEDTIVPRISLSPSIEGCLTAVPFGGSDLSESIYLPSDTSRLIRVYEFNIRDISKKHILYPKVLYQNDIVRDAEITQEHWVTTPLKPNKTYLIKLTRYNDQYGEDDIAYKYVNKYENGEIENIEPHLEGFITVINDVKFEIVPEARRSRLLKINYKLEHLNEQQTNSIIAELYELFPYSARIYLEIESKQNTSYLKGYIDTKGGEIDLKDLNSIIEDLIIDYSTINTTLSIA